MKTYEQQRRLLRRIVAAKAARRRELAALPIEEKIGIVVRLQELESSIRRATGRSTKKPWSPARKNRT